MIQRSEVSKPKNVSSLALVISKYINSDKTLQKMPILWNFWLKNAYYSYTVHVTLFHGMLLQKRKHFLESSLFSMALSQLEKRKHSVLSLVKIKTKLSKNFPFAMKFGIFGNSNTQRWYVFWFGYFWMLIHRFSLSVFIAWLPDPTPSASSLKINFLFSDFDT